MSHTYPLSFQNGHPLVELQDRQFLLDTGCPFSFGEGRPPEVHGKPITMLGPGGNFGFNLGAVRNLADQASGLLGMDLIERYQWEFNAGENKVTVSSGMATPTGEALIITRSQLGGVPILKGNYRGRETNILFDTGAFLSYHIGEPPAGLEACGEECDFNPQLGEINTPVWKDQILIGQRSVNIRFGRLPAEGEAPLRMMGVDWIIGQDLLKALHCHLDIQAGYLTLLP